MEPVGAVVIFVISWWLCLFMVLPIGVRSQAEAGEIVEGSEAGAPVRPMMVRKAIWATIGAAVLTVLSGLVIIPWLAGH
jgi:predicted secreted protein